MKLTKKMEAEVKEVYRDFWESLLAADLEKLNTLLDDNFRQIGTTDGEVFFTRQAASKFIKATEEQLVGNLELRNQKLHIEALDEQVLITDLSDAYVKIDNEWIFYARARSTFLLHKTVKGWKILLQHTSVPDHRADEGETIGLEKISKENLELREAVKRRTIELENKTRELEIESALERVRSVAMGMKKPDDMLDICRTISHQMALLGVKEIRNVQTAIFYEARGTYMNYEYYAKHDKTFITDVDFKTHKVQWAFAKKMIKGAGEKVEEHFKGKRLKDWYAYQKTTNQFADKYLLKADSLNYYWFSLGHVALGLSTYYPLTKEEIELFNRFLKVFELAYRRYLDIEKAEAQVREAQIQLALERVRARTMAMQKSDELPEAANLLFNQVQSLGMPAWSAGYCIWNEDKSAVDLWMSSEGVLQPPFNAPTTEDELFIQMRKGSEQGKTLHVVEMGGKKLARHYKYMRTLPVVGDILESIIAAGFPLPTFQIMHQAYFSKGFLLFITYEPVPESYDIFIRFANVFDQTYTRFLDLKKAEAQAREAEIELGLERVRARAMAMQHSDELAELVATVFTELNRLEFSLASCIIWIHNTAEKINTLWIASDEMNKPAKPLQVVPFYPPFFNSIVPAWKAKDPKWIFSLTGTEKKKFEKLFFKEYPELPDELKKPVSANKQITFSASFNNFGALEIVATVPLTDEKFEILHRFGKVFDSSYTRFNDLKKAEAQAREAQVEASMERVRSRTMAMQKSAELGDVAVLLYNELKNLGITRQFLETGYIEIDEVNKIQTGWMTNPTGGLLEPFHLPLTGEPAFDARYEAWKQLVPVFRQELSNEQLQRHIEFAIPFMENKEAEEISRTQVPKSLIFYCANFSHGYLSVTSETPLGAEAESLLARFTRVFEQTYKRFLDLKKAEVQAREAQVEASMERVRSRTMAMQKSAELGQVAVLLYNELKNLGVTQQFFETGYVEIDEVKKIQTGWTTTPDGNYLEPFYLPLNGEPVLDARYEAWKQRVPVFKQLVSGEALKRAIEFTLPFMDNKEAEEISRNAPDTIIFYCGNFSHGYLNINSDTPLGAEAESLLARFTLVFEQTYTRFLDLKKAEAQAREAQIEVAVERVRAQSMAMHQTSDLDKVNKELLHQLQWLKVQGLTGVSIMLIDEDDQVTIWDLSSPGNMGLPNSYSARYNARKYPLLGEPFQLFKQSLDYFTMEFPLEKLKKGIEEWREINENIANAIHAAVQNGSLTHQWNAFAKLSNGLLSIDLIKPPSDDTKTIVLKMAGAFNLAYQRFLDLQKAEAQAREAQIEAALERVRSRTMSMQKSEELGEVASVLFKQMNQLVTNLWTCGFVLCEKNRNEDEWWLSMDGDFTRGFFLPNVNDYAHATLYEGWLNGDTIRTVQLEGEALQQHYDWLMEIPVSRRIFEEMDAAGLARPDWQKLHAAYFSKGYLVLITREPCGEEEIFKRFAAVFNLTYTRFNDLQIAEAHAKQAEQDLIAIKEAKQKAEQALAELQATQKQLIQSEKMASLGELTAGIAHEIQNPLNFVNNFSEINKDLLEEVKSQNTKVKTEELDDILDDIFLNNEKILHHGKRADAIVKGMLQHSRSSSGEKEPTNINALADEYLRLAYHGLKAKDRSFNANFKTDFDKTIGNINIIPQDIGRVLLNLISNAFYTVNEKKKQIGGDYEPEVTVSTQLANNSNNQPISQLVNSLIISVRDNGNGIPQKILDKIFQPFFTTKPTGQGTGLGLSLSYDIVKAHGGELTVKTQDGQGSEFIIQLPLSVN